MANLQQALAVVLAQAAGVTALVGSRIYYEHVPQGAALPYLVRHEIAVEQSFLPVDGPSSLDRSRVQFVAWAETVAAADAVRRAVRAALDGYSATVTVGAESFEIQAAIPDIQVPIPDDDEATDTVSFGRAIDFIFHHQP